MTHRTAWCHTVRFLDAKHEEHHEQVVGRQQRVIAFAKRSTVSHRVVLSTVYRTMAYRRARVRGLKRTTPTAQVGAARHHHCKTDISIASRGTLHNVPYQAVLHCTIQYAWRHHLCKTANSIASCGTLRTIPYHAMPFSSVPYSMLSGCKT